MRPKFLDSTVTRSFILSPRMLSRSILFLNTSYCGLRTPWKHFSIYSRAMSQTKLTHEAQTGFAASSAYDAHRPSYPEEAVSQLLSALNIADVKGATIADLAAGTGKFTELIAARPEQYNIIGIEPHDGMRTELERKDLKGVSVVDGSAEAMPEVQDQSLDALVASQVSSDIIRLDTCNCLIVRYRPFIGK